VETLVLIQAERRTASSSQTETRRPDAVERFRAVRAATERLASRLSPEDQTVQSMPDASPTKWHRAHTTWFFEQFLLRPHVPDYRPYDERFAFLFNSYYVAAGPRHSRFQRGVITRPSTEEVGRYRAHADGVVEALLDRRGGDPEIETILEIGLNHEQQHQELILTDILHAFAQSPLLPAYDPEWRGASQASSAGEVALKRGIYPIGHDSEDFSFDNEGPPHEALIQDVKLSRRLVTNREWLGFMEDRGYHRPELWLSDGWAAARSEDWEAPGYWREVDGAWAQMTLGGLRAIDLDAPVRHVSHYEADAFARWCGKVLPSEFEWETAARAGLIDDAYGIVWQWTRSPYVAYPGYRPVEGALGEYNGKFMSNQIVLRGSSFATPAGHSRVTYRNFFYPGQRWQFTGVRLADDRG
jgi:ergothioneine biosynthesis protein EgtB